nr:protein Brevis radix-like 2 [Ipomoea batatas]
MLTCVACSKQLNTGSLPEAEEDDGIPTPSTKQAIKALTAQIKDMAVKASGAYKHCKPCSGGSSNNQNHSYADLDSGPVSESLHCAYRRAGSSNSTRMLRGKEMGLTIKGGFSSDGGTPASVSGRSDSVVFMEEDEPEWVAQVEPGVLITFVSLTQGGNDLKRIRFSREMFNKWEAQQWWAKNYDKVMELYNVQRFNHHAVPLPTPPRSEDENSKVESDDAPVTPPLSKERLPRHLHNASGLSSTPELSSTSAAKTETSSKDASARSSSSREIAHSGELSVSNASDMETEWIEEDKPGVYITIRALPGGTRELRRVRFSRERFGEMHARLWWEENRARIQQQYL